MNSRETDPVAAVREITGGRSRFYARIERQAAVLRQAIDALAIRGTAASSARPPWAPRQASM